jgi:hypothetical protein
MKRTLNLRRDELTELTTADLAEIDGGYQITQNCNTLQYCNIPTIPLLVCLSKVQG